MIGILAWMLLLSGLSVASLAVAKMGDVEGIATLLGDQWFLGGLAGILLAIVIRRIGASAVRVGDGLRDGGDLSSMKEKIASIIETLESLRGKGSGGISLKELAGRIDTLHSNEIFEVVEGRGLVIAEAGYGVYGSFMSDFATGERFISRSWSAAVDGYQEEAFEYVEKAITFFKKAGTQFEKVVPD